MSQWGILVQKMIEQIDESINNEDDEKLTLAALSQKLGYSEYYTSRMFSEISGMNFKDFLRMRRLAFSLGDLKMTNKSIIEIAVKYGFSSNEAFTRAFKKAYGITPAAYRKNPQPVELSTILRPFDCFMTETATETSPNDCKHEVKTYFIRIPTHKFLHIRNYKSIGYFDFWQKQENVPGCDFKTICNLLSGINGKLDDCGKGENDAGGGQLMAWINEPEGRICSWGIPLAEAYGVRLAKDYSGLVPPQMQLMDVAEGEYIVFEHGPFDFETESASVEAAIENAMKTFDFEKNGYALDKTQGRVFYFYHDCDRFFKYVRPVVKI